MCAQWTLNIIFSGAICTILIYGTSIANFSSNFLASAVD